MIYLQGNCQNQTNRNFLVLQRPERVPGGGVAARPARVVRARVHDLPPVQAHRAPAHARNAPPAHGSGKVIEMG